MSQQFPFVYLAKRIKYKISKRYLYIHVHSSIAQNSQKGEATQAIDE